VDKVGREIKDGQLVKEAFDPNGIEGFGHVQETAPVNLLPQKFLVIRSTRRANCKDVLCLGRNPNCSSLSCPRSPTSYKIVESRIFSNHLPIVSMSLMGR